MASNAGSSSSSSNGSTDGSSNEISSVSTPSRETSVLPDRHQQAKQGWELAQAAWLADPNWNLDGTRELSHLVKMATAQAHEDVLKPPIVDNLIMGKIPLEVHIKFLVMLYQIYEALESALDAHVADERLSTTHNPSILARTEAIGQDITHFLQLKPGDDWKDHPLSRHTYAHPPAELVEYLDRINSLSTSDGSQPPFANYIYSPAPASPYLLQAHAYVRYMGDLNGGQMIKNSVAKAYSLDTDAKDGLRFYQFNGPSGAPATASEVRKLVSAFRRGLDTTGTQLSPAEKAAYLQEANHAFELNVRLFASFSDDIENTEAYLRPTSPVAHIPEADAEGYAKAAAYMPKSLSGAKAEESKKAIKEDPEYSPILAHLPLAMLALFVAYLVARYMLRDYMS